MMIPNLHYKELKASYLFTRIEEKTAAYMAEHPGKRLLHLGIGDVSLPLCGAVIQALHEAVDDQADKDRFQGYQPECGAPFLREAIAAQGARIIEDDIFSIDEEGRIRHDALKTAFLIFSYLMQQGGPV